MRESCLHAPSGRRARVHASFVLGQYTGQYFRLSVILSLLGLHSSPVASSLLKLHSLSVGSRGSEEGEDCERRLTFAVEDSAFSHAMSCDFTLIKMDDNCRNEVKTVKKLWTSTSLHPYLLPFIPSTKLRTALLLLSAKIVPLNSLFSSLLPKLQLFHKKAGGRR